MSHRRYLKALQKRLNDRFKRRVRHEVRFYVNISKWLTYIAERGVRVVRMEYSLRPKGVRFIYFMPPVAERITLDFSGLDEISIPTLSRALSL